MKDYYKTLGVHPSSGHTDIKKAYRKLAFKYHPDINPENSLSEAQFKEIQEAYATLGNSQKRAKYDDERWLSGMGGKTNYKEAVTPAWLLEISIKLNEDLKKIDTYRMSHRALRDYTLLLLTNAHLGILLSDGTPEINKKIITEVLKAIEILESGYQDEILNQLIILANGDEETIQKIRYQNREKKKAEFLKKLFPYIVAAITLALCLVMYFFGQL